eukprot:NODE_2669_length_1146_cov_38.864175_g2447_i0.p1 GENE.NODE_2669_length_1146_cov_38.864175_g2447_i0~~NODE_2669_length_1146_cov_38.864175_g2447_i0.p1  ORF type:complete len:329 (+),score=45.41 NODE_2669_length_1146_cov_38.864175_g2447_i0:62-1048(+)
MDFNCRSCRCGCVSSCVEIGSKGCGKSPFAPTPEDCQLLLKLLAESLSEVDRQKHRHKKTAQLLRERDRQCDQLCSETEELLCENEKQYRALMAQSEELTSCRQQLAHARFELVEARQRMQTFEPETTRKVRVRPHLVGRSFRLWSNRHRRQLQRTVQTLALSEPMLTSSQYPLRDQVPSMQDLSGCPLLQLSSGALLIANRLTSKIREDCYQNPDEKECCCPTIPVKTSGARDHALGILKLLLFWESPLLEEPEPECCHGIRLNASQKKELPSALHLLAQEPDGDGDSDGNGDGDGGTIKKASSIHKHLCRCESASALRTVASCLCE